VIPGLLQYSSAPVTAFSDTKNGLCCARLRPSADARLHDLNNLCLRQQQLPTFATGWCAECAMSLFRHDLEIARPGDKIVMLPCRSASVDFF
jgi:hypothetical protein